MTCLLTWIIITEFPIWQQFIQEYIMIQNCNYHKIWHIYFEGDMWFLAEGAFSYVCNSEKKNHLHCFVNI